MLLETLFFLPLLTLASTDSENRSKRQLFPAIHERIHDRIENIERAGGLLPAVRNRIHDRVDLLRNATKAAKGCFQNEHGFKCCSLQLFNFMGTTFRIPLVERLLARVDLQKVVDKVVELVQTHFDTSFEVIISPTDFASKNTFRGDLMCKSKTPNGKIILVYATPVPYSTQMGVLRRLTEAEIKGKHWAGNLLEVFELPSNRAH